MKCTSLPAVTAPSPRPGHLSWRRPQYIDISIKEQSHYGRDGAPGRCDWREDLGYPGEWEGEGKDGRDLLPILARDVGPHSSLHYNPHRHISASTPVVLTKPSTSSIHSLSSDGLLCPENHHFPMTYMFKFLFPAHQPSPAPTTSLAACLTSPAPYIMPCFHSPLACLNPSHSVSGNTTQPTQDIPAAPRLPASNTNL